jgi:hypothetical protein
MKKLAKKFEQHITHALTTVCEQAKFDIDGFEWVTHTANYDNFPSSLKITCVFSTRASLAKARSAGQLIKLVDEITKHLLEFKIELKSPSKHISFDTDQGGAKERLL